MQKNSLYEGKVLALGTEGEGVLKVEGTTAFVPFCLVGEEVRFKAVKVGAVAYGKLDNVLEPSPDRVHSPCPVFTKCGGCTLQHMSYDSQLEFKRAQVEGTLFKIGGIKAEVSPTVPCDSPYRYRNKLALPIGEGENGVELGFYAPRSHRIVPVDDCLIQAEWVKEIIAAVKNFAHVSGFHGYDPVTGKGELRQIVVREIGGRFIIALVASRVIKLDLLAKELEKSFAEFTLLLNVNNTTSNVIFGKEWRVCRGEGFFEAEEKGIKYRAGANTFLQVNDDVRGKLYARVLEGASADGAVAVDLYSGGGMLTAMLAKKCGLAYGVEVVEEASRCADELMRANGLEGKMHNICGKVEDMLDKVFELTAGRRRVIVCDPPRKGMERSVVKKLAESTADKIILVSCNPATLARDLGILTGTLKEENGALVKAASAKSGNYVINSVTPFDMFPQTKHVETLVVLSKKIPDSHINVEVEFGEGEGQLSLKKIREHAEARKPKEKVTYKMIQNHIEKTYGFKVHTAYIAEVKRELGLPMYDAPNAVEELKHPRPHPTPRMVEAIKETLKHFEII